MKCYEKQLPRIPTVYPWHKDQWGTWSFLNIVLQSISNDSYFPRIVVVVSTSISLFSNYLFHSLFYYGDIGLLSSFWRHLMFWIVESTKQYDMIHGFYKILRIHIVPICFWTMRYTFVFFIVWRNNEIGLTIIYHLFV